MSIALKLSAGGGDFMGCACDSCSRGFCGRRFEMARLSLLAWLDDKPMPVCDEQVLTWQAKLAA
jgi:hypothetical protein